MPRSCLARRINSRSIASVFSQSAITPSFNGRMATTRLGVLPIMFLASSPTARTWSVVISIATTLGSRSTMPRPLT